MKAILFLAALFSVQSYADFFSSNVFFQDEAKQAHIHSFEIQGDIDPEFKLYVNVFYETTGGPATFCTKADSVGNSIPKTNKKVFKVNSKNGKFNFKVDRPGLSIVCTWEISHLTFDIRTPKGTGGISIFPTTEEFGHIQHCPVGTRVDDMNINSRVAGRIYPNLSETGGVGCKLENFPSGKSTYWCYPHNFEYIYTLYNISEKSVIKDFKIVDLEKK